MTTLSIPAPEDRLTLSAAAAQAGVTTGTIWRWTLKPLKDGRRLQTFRIGGRRFVLKSELASFISPAPVAAAEPQAAIATNAEVSAKAAAMGL